ncbi:MAG: BON domain-containing protein [Terriglobia bacterium]
MRNKLPLLTLAVVVGTGLGWAAPPTTDSQAVASIQSRLGKAKVNRHGEVQVTYAGGVATLTGTVDNLGSKLDAEKAAQKVQGVKQVLDNIQVRADDVTPQQMLEQARHEIVMYYAYGIFDNVNFEAHNGTLTVSGQVTQPFKKTDIGNILERVKGVAELNNNLEVLPLSTFDDRLRLQVARAIYGDPFFIRYANQALPPIHIIVKNGNVTLEGVVASTLDRTKAEMAALHTGLSFAVVDHLQVERS